MIIKTPPLSVRTVNVFGALFKAQLPDTVADIRRAIPDWAAVHVILQPGVSRNAPSEEEMRDMLVAELEPLAMLHDSTYALGASEIPRNTVATLVPDHFKPSFAPEYQGWKFIYYADAREKLAEFLGRALGGVPEGNVGVADALVKGKINGQAVMDAWSMSTPLPTFKRTVESLVKKESRVIFWDTSFGFETTGEAFLRSLDLVFSGMLDVKNDRLYFDATDFSWFVVFYPGGQMRVGLLG